MAGKGQLTKQLTAAGHSASSLATSGEEAFKPRYSRQGSCACIVSHRKLLHWKRRWAASQSPSLDCGPRSQW